MTNETHRFFRLCPRGFANEVTYFRVPADQAAEVDTYFADYSDRNPDGSARWLGEHESSDAYIPGVAVEWADRAYIGII